MRKIGMEIMHISCSKQSLHLSMAVSTAIVVIMVVIYSRHDYSCDVRGAQELRDNWPSQRPRVIVLRICGGKQDGESACSNYD